MNANSEGAPTRVSAQVLDTVDQLLTGRSERRRWQAAIILGEFADTDPAMIWPLVVKHGSRKHEDVRTAIATCVLEHVLEHHFEPYFSMVEELVIRNEWFAETFRSCWPMGQAEEPANLRRWKVLRDRLAR